VVYLIISLREALGGKDPGNGASFIGPKVRTNPNRRFAVLEEALRYEFDIFLGETSGSPWFIRTIGAFQEEASEFSSERIFPAVF